MDPKEIDFLGLKALLGNYLDGALFSSSELCDTIIAQNTVGTVLKAQGAGDDVDPIAIMSVMNLQRRKEMKWMQETIAYLKKNCPKDLKDQFESLLGEEGVGLIINERVINVPQETAQPLVNLLFDEISNATEDEPTEELRESFKFKKYILLTRTFVEDDAEPAGAGGGKRKRDAAPEMVYPRPEDQFFHKVSKMSFQWKSRELGDNDDVDSYQPTRLCMVIDADSVPQVRKQVKEMFTGDFEMRL